MYLFELEFLFFLDICPGVGLLGHMVAHILGFLMKLHTIFHSDVTNLHFHQQHRRVISSPYLLQYLLFVDVFMIVILTGMR